jgi:hypothetical protein
MRKMALVLGVLGVLAVLVGGVALFRSAPPAPVLPSPNGYQDFQQALKVVGRTPSKVSELSPEELREALKEEEKTIALIQAGLAKECAVPLEYGSGYIRPHLAEMAGLKGLNFLFAARARLVASTNAAAGSRAYIDSIRFADEIGRGGLIIDHLSGLACRHFGVKHLDGVKNELDAPQCREVLDQLVKIYRRRQRSDDVLAREEEWIRRSGDWRTRAVRILRPGLVEPVEQKYVQRVQAGEAEMKKLMQDFAVRIRELEKGTNVSNLVEMVREL